MGKQDTDSDCGSPEGKIMTELGVSVLSKVGKTPLEKSKFYNARLALIREAVLNTLCTMTRETTETLHCVDAVGGTGVTGLQWKVRLKNLVHVTITEKEHITEVQSNCERNRISDCPLPLDMSRVPGDPMVSQRDQEVHTCKCTAPVLLHMEAFDFVYLYPHSNISGHIDAAVTNIRNNGVLCLVSTDSTHQFTRSAVSVRRHFGATVTKTEYLKELAARVIIGSIVRAAAKCNKGVEVLYVLFVEDFFLVAVKVLRGPKFADSCTDRIRRLLHCQMCEERVFYPLTNTPIEHPYTLLPCRCQDTTPGKTALVLGPMWSGELFSSVFLARNLINAKEEQFSKKLHSIWTVMLDEVRCVQSIVPKETENGSNPTEEPCVKRQKLCDSGVSQMSTESGSDHEQMPPFFYNVLRRKWKGIDVPKYPVLLDLLHREGHRASRTHFDFGGIRTSATLTDVTLILSKHCQLTQQSSVPVE
ncbi:TRMT1-like protein [Mizuhopecten yessoensis]|uniref:tRNA (guanine(26)-N(2))-dimethyltransferase n=2 Tax=Mizuhopecten yessoensis TaxID=6573 RepID=A0A210R5C1_MIZYE|nr:TRMT1-like protein [Mizuhopecten yessoensis]